MAARDYYTLPEAVAASGIPRETFVRVAARLRIGFRSAGGSPLYTATHIRRIVAGRQDGAGRPRKVAATKPAAPLDD